MTKEELEKEAEVFVSEKVDKGNFDVEKFGKAYFSESSMKQALVKFAEPREKRIAELEEKISVLLSCKNCPENKGGYICKKEYENKCLSQKIQFIKELQQENAGLKSALDEKENTVHTLDVLHKEAVRKYGEVNDKLTKAKYLLKQLVDAFPKSYSDVVKDTLDEARKFVEE